MGQKGIHKEMLQVYTQNCVSYKAVHYWVQTFCQGHIQIADKAQSGVLLNFPMKPNLVSAQIAREVCEWQVEEID